MKIAPLHWMCVVLFLHRMPPGAAQGAQPKCSADQDCRTVVNGSSTCTEGNCECYDELRRTVLVTVSDKWYCMSAFNETGGDCLFDKQCEYDGGKCSANRTCACSIRYFQEDHGCTRYVKSPIIPIAVGVTISTSVVMTLCLYVWLSRGKK